MMKIRGYDEDDEDRGDDQDDEDRGDDEDDEDHGGDEDDEVDEDCGGDEDDEDDEGQMVLRVITYQPGDQIIHWRAGSGLQALTLTCVM